MPAYFLEPPEWVFDLDKISDDVQLVDVYPVFPAGATTPPTPLVPTAPRIAVGGGALALAESALARGDAFDAAAQLRSLLAAARPEARPYLEVQLCRAYVALDRFDDADRLLRTRVALGSSDAWPAVFELARLHVVHLRADPSDTWEWLSPYALPLRNDLAFYLMKFTSSADEIAQLRGVVAPPRAPDLVTRCANELAAFEAKHPHGLPGWRICPVTTAPPVPIGHTATEKDQLVRIVGEVESWSIDLYRKQQPDEERWLNHAHRMGDIVARDPNAPAAVLATWLALLAYQNAANIAGQKGGTFDVTSDYLLYANAQIDRLHPQFRADLWRISRALLRVKP